MAPGVQPLTRAYRVGYFNFHEAPWLSAMFPQSRNLVTALANQFAMAGTEALESRDVFATPEIIRAGGGSVVNMSSGAALRGASPAHVYTAAKGAILSLTRAMAGAYVHQGVRVNAICAGRTLSQRILATVGTPENPGPVADRQDPAGRQKEYPFWVGQPEDIANIALFLASEESRMITGASIPAEGGRSAY